MTTTRKARETEPGAQDATEPAQPAEETTGHDTGDTTTAVPVLWEVTTEDRRGHQRVTRVRAGTRDEALAAAALERELDDRARPTVIAAEPATPPAPPAS